MAKHVISDELADVAEAAAPAPAKDKLETLRGFVATARELEKIKADLEEQLDEKKSILYQLYFFTIPQMMDEMGLPSITIKADGNMPEVKISTQPYYSASIAASWPEEKRKEAFTWLEDNGFGDLIKTEVIAQFAREKREEAVAFARLAEQQKGVVAMIKENVHAKTLTAWLTEQVEKHNMIPPLDLIGGTIGRIAKLKETK